MIDIILTLMMILICLMIPICIIILSWAIWSIGMDIEEASDE